MKWRKCKFILMVFAAVVANAMVQLPITARAATRYTRMMEYIDRGLVAIPKSYGDETTGMYLSWRLLGTESLADTTFDIYKDGEILVSDYNGTNYTDTANANGSDTSAVYQVVPAGEELTADIVPANTVVVNGNQVTLTMTGGYENSSSSENNCYGYFDIPLNIPADVSDSIVGDYSYTANDCSVGDVDGDGQYEIIVKWDPNNSLIMETQVTQGRFYYPVMNLTELSFGQVLLIWAKISEQVLIIHNLWYTILTVMGLQK